MPPPMQFPHTLDEDSSPWKENQRPPQPCCKDVCKRDMKALDINTESWEDLAADCMMWRSTLNQHLKSGEEKLMNTKVGKRAWRRECNNSNRPETTPFLQQRLFLKHRSLQPQVTQSNRTARMHSHDQTWSTEALYRWGWSHGRVL